MVRLWAAADFHRNETARRRGKKVEWEMKRKWKSRIELCEAA